MTKMQQQNVNGKLLDEKPSAMRSNQLLCMYLTDLQMQPIVWLQLQPWQLSCLHLQRLQCFCVDSVQQTHIQTAAKILAITDIGVYTTRCLLICWHTYVDKNSKNNTDSIQAFIVTAGNTIDKKDDSSEVHRLHSKYLPSNLCGFSECLTTMNFQLAFHVPLNRRVIVVQLYLPTQIDEIITSSTPSITATQYFMVNTCTVANM